MTETDKFAYFLSKYRSMDTDELNELAPKVDSLAEEASEALRQVLNEKGLTGPPVSSRPPDEPRELEDDERKVQSKLSSDLWNGPISKRVEFLFAAQALAFGAALAGSQGLKLGALPLVAIAGILMYFARRLGRSTTRSICADGDTSIEVKTKALKSLSLWLWPALLLSSAAGILVARAFTGA